MAGIIFSEGSGKNNPIFGEFDTPIKKLIEDTSESYEKKAVMPILFEVYNSENASESVMGMTAMDDFKATGENGLYPLTDNGLGMRQTFRHRTFRNSFAVSYEMVKDSKMIDFKKKPVAFTKSYYRTRERLGAALIGGAIEGQTTVNYAEDNFSTLAGDGVVLFGNHRLLNKGTQVSNVFSNAFSDDALGMVETAMQNFTDEDGNLLDVAPDTIVIPNDHALKKAVFAAIGADKDPNTANNGFNYQFGRWNIVVWNELNRFITQGTTPWILLDSEYNKEIGTAYWFDREDLTVRSIIDDKNDANLWLGRARFSAGFYDWRGMAVGGVSRGTALS